MSRVRADDYGLKYTAILDSAAALFAKVGYPSTKLQDIARDCGATKSMLYHYFPTKDDLLLALLSEHLERLILDIEEAISGDASVSDRFDALIKTYVLKSVQSRQRHLSAMNDVKFLPAAMQSTLRKQQKTVTDLVTFLLRELNPTLPAKCYKPYTLMLLGMLNWLDLWFHTDGAMSADELCLRISHLFKDGYMRGDAVASTCPGAGNGVKRSLSRD